MKKSLFLSSVLSSAIIMFSCLTLPVVSAETTDYGQIRKLLETFIEQNYKGEARVAGGSECVEVLLFGNTPEFDGEVITNDFNQFLSENNIEPSLISFKVLEGVVVASVNTGDVDLNGTIDVTDLTELSLALVGDKELAADQKLAADIDGDGAVTIADLARLQQYLSKKCDSLR